MAIKRDTSSKGSSMDNRSRKDSRGSTPDMQIEENNKNFKGGRKLIGKIKSSARKNNNSHSPERVNSINKQRPSITDDPSVLNDYKLDDKKKTLELGGTDQAQRAVT